MDTSEEERARRLAADAWRDDVYARLVIAPDRRILVANARAEHMLQTSPALDFRDERLHAAHPADDKALGAALRKRWRKPTLFAARSAAEQPGAPIAISLSSGQNQRGGAVVHARMWVAAGYSSVRARYLADLYGMTRQERRILGHILDGRESEWTCARENIAILTYRTHVRNIYRKLSATSRGDILRIALSFAE